MGVTVLSEDLVAICLLLADAELTTSLETIICRAEAVGIERDRQFGVASDEWRGLFVFLLWPEDEAVQVAHGSGKLRLAHVIPRMLAYGGAYCNDEGEHWLTREQVAAEMRSGYLETPMWETNTSLSPDDRAMRVALRRLWEPGALSSLTAGQVKQLMVTQGIGAGPLGRRFGAHRQR